MKYFRTLFPDEIECRVQACYEKGVSVLLYKTARTDANLLDETVGCQKWQNKFEVKNGVLFCSIGVDYGNGMVWKENNGSESNMEAEKGRASDAFKRAGFMHGIGRELYSAPFIWIPADKCEIKPKGTGKNGKPIYTCKSTFAVKEIAYDDKDRISKLVLVSGENEVFWYDKSRRQQLRSGDTTRPTNSNPPRPAPQPNGTPPTTSGVPTCSKCDEIIDAKVHNYSMKYYGKPLCRDCQKSANGAA